MSGDAKLRFFLACLFITVFCSSCTWIRSNGEWSFKKKDLTKQIQKNRNDYNANYTLGVAYVIRGERYSLSSSLKKIYFKKAIRYLEEAIRIKPESAEAHLALGEIFGTDNINDGVSAIKHTVLAKKLSEKESNTKGVVKAESNLRVLSKKYFSFYLLGFSEIHIPEQL